MTVLTFESESMFTIVLSLVAYTSLVAVVVLAVQLRRTRRRVKQVFEAVFPPSSGTSAAPVDHMAEAVARWADTQGTDHVNEGAGDRARPRSELDRLPRPGGSGSSSGVALPAPRVAVPRTDRSRAAQSPRGSDRGLESPARRSRALPDPAWAPPSAAALPPADRKRAAPWGRPRTAGAESRQWEAHIFSGGNGRGQDRALFSRGLNVSARSASWWSFSVLCDGVSGTGDGGRAAETAVEAFRAALEQALSELRRPADSNITEVENVLWDSVAVAHSATRELSRDPLLRGSATTLEAVVLVAPHGRDDHLAVVAHVGDGAVWLLDSAGLHRRTVRPGAGQPDTLGAGVELNGDVLQFSVPLGAQVLLTSDGFESGLRQHSSDREASAAGAALVRAGAGVVEVAERLGTLADLAADDVTVVAVG